MKSLYIIFVLTGITVIFSASTPKRDAAKQQKNDYIAWINIDTTGSTCQAQAFCRNETSCADSLSYTFRSVKSGASGTASSSQSGRIFLPPSTEKCLSQSRFNQTSGDYYHIILKIYKGTRIVAADSLVINPIKKKQ